MDSKNCFTKSHIGRYRLLGLCGAGSYGKVFLAENELTSQRIALKLIDCSQTGEERERIALCKYHVCRHPALLVIHHVDIGEDGLYYTMDVADNLGDENCYIPATLENRVQLHGALSEEEVWSLAIDLLDGLRVLHGNHLLHRDIKPSNVLWVNGHVVLGDIGLIAHNATAGAIGTPQYMSPKFFSEGCHTATEADDLYSLGMTLYYALTGRRPVYFPDLPKELKLKTILLEVILWACSGDNKVSADMLRNALLERITVRRRRTDKRRRRRYIVLFCIMLYTLGIIYKPGAYFREWLFPPAEPVLPIVDFPTPYLSCDKTDGFKSERSWADRRIVVPSFFTRHELFLFSNFGEFSDRESEVLAQWDLDWLTALSCKEWFVSEKGIETVHAYSDQSYYSNYKSVWDLLQNYHVDPLPFEMKAEGRAVLRELFSKNSQNVGNWEELHRMNLSKPGYLLVFLDFNLRKAVAHALLNPGKTAGDWPYLVRPEIQTRIKFYASLRRELILRSGF